MFFDDGTSTVEVQGHLYSQMYIIQMFGVLPAGTIGKSQCA